jgi:ornithine cyclodeaminase/alanine dehydrogenase-like protein (mu-crystallin family)
MAHGTTAGIRYFSSAAVLDAVDPSTAVDVVREGFVQLAAGSWHMPPKVYVDGVGGDFRAMPATGGGYALLKWVTSFPENPKRGLPTVTGLVLLSSAATGELLCALHAGAVTALRTGAAAVVAAEGLAGPERRAGVIGCGVNGGAVARAFASRGWRVLLWDADRDAAARWASDLGEQARVASDPAEALRCPTIATVTPGRERVVTEGMLVAGQHVCLMGADGPGKAEIAAAELVRARVFCDEWEQASHSGDIATAVRAGLLTRDQVTDLGDVLAGHAAGRRAPDDITVFDSTGLAVQDLAIARAVYERFVAGGREAAGVQTIDL